MNSRRDIPAANFVMHVTHCQRNLTLCKECGEPVPTSQQEEHFEEYHAKVCVCYIRSYRIVECSVWVFKTYTMPSVNEKNLKGQ